MEVRQVSENTQGGETDHLEGGTRDSFDKMLLSQISIALIIMACYY